MEKEIKIKSVCTYSGHSINQQGIFNLTLIFDYSEITKVIELLQCLNEDISIYTKAGDKKNKMGVFGIKNISINSNGESKVKFVSLVHSVEMDVINDLISADIIRIGFVSKIEIAE